VAWVTSGEQSMAISRERRSPCTWLVVARNTRPVRTTPLLALALVLYLAMVRTFLSSKHTKIRGASVETLAYPMARMLDSMAL
jgi:hypothetical protein